MTTEDNGKRRDIVLPAGGRWRWWLLPAVVVVLVGAVAVPVLLHRRAAGYHETIGPGGRTLSYAGVRITVPAGWPRNELRCGTPVVDTYVVEPGPATACALRDAPAVNYVMLRRSSDVGADRVAGMATVLERLDGEPVRTGRDRLPDGRDQRVVVLPEQGLVIEFGGTDLALLDRIAASIHLR